MGIKEKYYSIRCFFLLFSLFGLVFVSSLILHDEALKPASKVSSQSVSGNALNLQYQTKRGSQNPGALF